VARRTADIGRRLGLLATWVLLLAAVAALAFFGIGPRTGKYRTLTVLSGSMVPTFDPGDSIVVAPVAFDRLRVGDVITYRIPVDDERVVTHRIVEIKRTGGSNPVVVTKGDANDERDSWEAQLQGSTAWVYRARVPKAGYVLHAVRGPALQVASIGALVLFGLLALWRVWRPERVEATS
jgi:signal peptidase